MSEYINKIKIGNTEYDIQASSIGTVSEVSISNTTESKINFTTGSNTGEIKLNAKGNLSVESFSKHVNIESAKAIQLKPTTSVIIDTARKVAAGNDNEASIVVKNDDASSGEEHGYLKLEARAIDLRCFDHGGVAIQPCGHDSSNHENKIKFESDRKVSANATANPTTDYNGEGGKGVEFGTFNNEHTSIFSKDYRFNESGKVYSVVRGDITTNSKGKSDYPTQNDDFKDILRTNKDTNAVCNNSGVWSVNDPTKEYIMGATWKSIVKTANALNDQDWTDTNISGKGNLQITTVDEVEWVEVTGYSGDAITLASDKQDPKRKYVGDGNVYKLADEKYYTCELKTNGEHHLNLESESTIKLESGYDDIELTAGDKVQSVAPVVQFEATSKVDFSTTPEVSFMARKINKSGGYESSDAILKITSLNNFGRTVYENETLNTVRIPYTTLYTSSGEYTPVIINTEKVAVYESDRTTNKPIGSYILQLGNLNLLYTVEAGTGDNVGKNVLGKKAKVCDNSTEVNLYTENTATTAFKLDPTTDYTGNEPTLYTAADTTATEGYYIARSESNARYIIYIDDNHKLAKFNVNNNGTGNTFVQGWYLEGSKQIVGDYSGITFGGNDEAGSGEVAIQNGAQLNVGNMQCNINDIVALVNAKDDIMTLVNYFKTGAGQADGPWAPGL